MNENYLDDVFSSKQKHESILESIRSFEDDPVQTSTSHDDVSGYFLPSKMYTQTTSKQKEKKKKPTDDDWWGNLMEYSTVKIEKHKHGTFDDDLFGTSKKHKHKHKDKDKDKRVDYNKEFEPELALYKNLLINQSNFTNALQKEYDEIKSIKSASRGVNKNLTDLIENITEARTLQMQLVEKQVSAKKLIAELTMKQAKDTLNEDGSDAGLLGASTLKSILDNRNLFSGGGDTGITITDADDDIMYNTIDNISLDDDRSNDTNTYLKYEKAGVVVRVCVANDDIENYWFEARDAEYNLIDDYPLPLRTNISVNRSTNIATDTYGKKYEIVWK